MEINVIAPINQLGYGIAGLNITKSLSNLCKTALWPIGPVDITSMEDAKVIKACIENSYMPNYQASCVRIWHQHDMSQFVGKNNHIGFPFFELNKFSAQEIHQLNSLDILFVASEWAKTVCLEQLNIEEERIKVVPLGVDKTIFRTNAKHTANTIFFNCGKWEVRKGHDVLIEIFCKAFEPSDNVELWMMPSNPFLKTNEVEEWEKLYLQSKLGDKINIISRQNNQHEVYNIMSQIDCGVFPSRAEGWNLELLELMACGKNVIATNYSAHTEFCNSNNCYMIDVNDLEVAYDGKWFHGQGDWAKIDEDAKNQAVEHMRAIHRKKQEQSLNINQAGLLTAEQYSWNNTARKIIQYV